MGWLRNANARLTDWHRIFQGEKLQRGIMPSDIDGIIEANGQFLVMETKHASEGMDYGQERTLRQLARLEGFTVLRIDLDSNGDVGEVYEYSSDSGSPLTPEAFRLRGRKWIERADHKGL